LLSATYSVKGYKTLVEVKECDDNDNRHQRLDILVCNCDSPTYGYELVVAPTLEHFRDHVRRAKHYAKVHKTNNMFIVNLCPKPSVDYFEEMTSVRRSSRLANKVQPCYAENLQQPPEPFVFPTNVTVMNVTIRKENKGLVANLVYRDGKENTIVIKGSEWYM
ncbi:8384_t:CDS:1, partial [Paraglomus brasilianum]